MQQKKLVLTQGDILRILVAKDARLAPEIAKQMGYGYRQALNNLYDMTQLPPDVIRRASEVLGVDPSVFSTDELLRQLYENNDTMQTMIKQYEECRQTNDLLREEVRILRQQVDLFRNRIQ